MNRVWARLLTSLTLLGLGCLIVWPVFGVTAAIVVFASGLFLCVINHLRNISRLLSWLDHPDPEQVPISAGAWDEVYTVLYRLLRRQRQSESQLTATLKDFQQATAAMPDGMVILDHADRIEWCNPQAERHFGLDGHRDVGQQVTYLVRYPQFAEKLQAQNSSEPLILRQSFGSDLVLSVLVVPYGDRQKLVISRDITSVERAETMRRDFIANVSHELRTPLTVLSGFIETISDHREADSSLLHRSLPLMMEQARRMQRLVEDLLTLSRLESTDNPLDEKSVDVPELVRVLYADAVAFSAGRHQIALHVDCEDWLTGAEEELRSAFGNLISNAIRYTPGGGEVTIRWARRGDDVVFSVRDTGIGIERQHIPRLTERFYRVDRSRSRETGGTGLGLAIVKHVLSRHQGRLEIASEPGHGSIFSAVFPAERVILAQTNVAVARTA